MMKGLDSRLRMHALGGDIMMMGVGLGRVC